MVPFSSTQILGGMEIILVRFLSARDDKKHGIHEHHIPFNSAPIRSTRENLTRGTTRTLVPLHETNHANGKKEKFVPFRDSKTVRRKKGNDLSVPFRSVGSARPNGTTLPKQVLRPKIGFQFPPRPPNRCHTFAALSHHCKETSAKTGPNRPPAAKSRQFSPKSGKMYD